VPRTAAILSALLLTLFTAACSGSHKAAEGFMLGIATAPASCMDNVRIVIATATSSHRARLNTEPELPIAEVSPRLREVMRYRAERVVYVRADADVSWGEFVELVDHVWPEADVVSLITPQVDAEARRTICLSPCGNCARLRSFHPPR